MGTDRAYNHYAWGWAWAGNTPFRLWKRYTWLGGTRTPLIAHWPAAITDAGAVRPAFVHAVDLAPTVLDAAGVESPAVVDGHDQQALHGSSLVPSFTDPDVPTRRVQYFEMLGSRSIYFDGWKATTDHVGSQVKAEVDLLAGSREFATDHWALFDLAADFSEANDVAAVHPEKVRELEARWWLEAGRHNVLPLDDGFMTRYAAMPPLAYPPPTRAEFRPGGGPVVSESMPVMLGGFDLTAELSPTEGDDEADGATPLAGILVAQGNWTTGWAVYVGDGRLVYSVNTYGSPHRVISTDPVPAGAASLSVSYTRTPPVGGAVVLCADDRVIGSGRLEENLPFVWQIGGHGMTIGRDWGLPVDDFYRPPFAFTGTIRRVVIAAKDPTTPPPQPPLLEALHSE